MNCHFPGHGELTATTALFAMCMFGSAACSPSAQEPTTLELRVRGSDASVLPLGGTGTLRLESAQLAFGPLTFCPGAQSGALCETARLEWRDAAVIDLLGAQGTSIGKLVGTTGTVRSYMYDLGFVSLLTQKDPLLMSAAEELDGHSLIIEGEAESSLSTTIVPFVVRLSARQSEDVDRGQPVVRLTAPPGLPFDVTSTTRSVQLDFWVSDLLDGLEETAFFQDAPCETTTHVCHDQLEEDCATGETTDCSSQGEVCAPDLGCREQIVLTDDTKAGRRILARLVSGTPPKLTFR